MQTTEEWATSFAHETLHSWMLRGYPNLHTELKDALMFAVAYARTATCQETPEEAIMRLLGESGATVVDSKVE